MKNIALLGSTGSIGQQTLVSCRSLGYGVELLAANSSIDLLEQQAREFCPRYVVISDKNAYRALKLRLADTKIRLLAGVDGMCEAIAQCEAQTVCNAVVGMVGLAPTLAAIEAGKTVALANKETLVAAGELVMGRAAAKKVAILPVDSEHSAIFQCLQGTLPGQLERILLTASGGPFRGKKAAELEDVSREQALRHPNWEMGAKITIDSATLMNKGLEFIEAMWLFGVRPEQIEVLVHPQSVVHSAVELVDGSVLAQLGTPDMVIPIQYALTYPERAPTAVRRLSLAAYGTLTFERPDYETFVCLRACIEAIGRGGLFPCAVNGANEQAVALFLAGKISFGQIGRAVAHVLANFHCKVDGHYTFEMVLEADRQAREMVLEYCTSR